MWPVGDCLPPPYSSHTTDHQYGAGCTAASGWARPRLSLHNQDWATNQILTGVAGGGEGGRGEKLPEKDGEKIRRNLKQSNLSPGDLDTNTGKYFSLTSHALHCTALQWMRCWAPCGRLPLVLTQTRDGCRREVKHHMVATDDADTSNHVSMCHHSGNYELIWCPCLVHLQSLWQPYLPLASIRVTDSLVSRSVGQRVSD